MSEFDQEIREDDAFASFMDGSDVEGVHERVFIPDKTECVLKLDGFVFDTTKGLGLDDVAIIGAYSIVFPDEHADGASDFKSFYGCNPKVKEGNKTSRFAMARAEFFRIVAGALQKRIDDPEVRGFFTPSPGEVNGKDLVGSALPFLVERLNTLKGREFPTKVRLSPETKNPDGTMKYRARQEVGAVQFPGCDERKRRAS